MTDRANSFDDVRLAAAVTVLVAHSPLAYGVGGAGIFVGPFYLGSLAVEVFFAISGYLIAQSWHADPNPAVFEHVPLASADSTNVARNIGIDARWKGTYAPASKETRAAVLVERIERTVSTDRFTHDKESAT